MPELYYPPPLPPDVRVTENFPNNALVAAALAIWQTPDSGAVALPPGANPFFPAPETELGYGLSWTPLVRMIARSVRAMRADRLENFQTGGIPDSLRQIAHEQFPFNLYQVVTETESAALQTAMKGDAYLSAFQFELDAYRAYQQQPSTLDFRSPDGLAPYSPERLAERDLAAQLKQLKEAESQAIAELIRQGLPPEQVLAISQTATATDPFTERISQASAEKLITGQAPLTQTQALALPVDQPVVETDAVYQRAAALQITPFAVNLSLPIFSGNLPNQQAMREVIFHAPQLDKIMGIYAAAPDSWQPILNRTLGREQQLAEKDKWLANYPKVELLGRLNPQVDLFTLNTIYTGSAPPPLVIVLVTPRQKELPVVQHNLFGQVWTWLGPIAGQIPLVGTVLSIAGNYAAQSIARGQITAELQALKQSLHSDDEFMPQFNPQPFRLVLPLDLAQMAVRQPWYIAPLYRYYIQHQTESAVAAASPAPAATSVQPSAFSLPPFSLSPFALALPKRLA